MVNDELGKRLKHNYEEAARTRLVRRMPVAIRVDGKAFHTFARGLKKPFDDILSASMQKTMLALCENIQGCVFGYTQSDEITLILVDYKKLTSDAWFDYEVQKMCSIAASMATNYFNRAFTNCVEDWIRSHEEPFSDEDLVYFKTILTCRDKGAMFDARCFNIPKEEVANLIYWRQLDATRNSIEMVARAFFSHKECEHKNCSMLQDMLMNVHGVNWNNYPTMYKRGSCAIKDDGWHIDYEIPIFKGEGRAYIENRVIGIEEE